MAIKESIHREPTRRHQSPVRRKSQQQQQQSHKSPPPRKLSPQRMKKLKKPIAGDSPLQSRGTVTKLLKKVKKLEPFSTRSKENRSSLKDKLSNIIGGKKSDEEETGTVQLKSKDKSPEVEKREVTKSQPVADEVQKKQDVVVKEEKKKEVTVVGKKQENYEDLRQVTLTTKPESTTKESPEVSQPAPPQTEPPPPPPPAKEEEHPPEPDEDLQLRVIALRSAVMKKHRTRIARAKKQQQLLLQKQQKSNNEPIPRIESPFTSSFNEDFPLLAEICSPSSPLDSNKEDIYCPEDMELDSDMELNKEISMVLSGAEDDTNNIVDGDSPYSPTDELGSPKGATDQPMDLSMYTPSKPTETPMHVPDNIRKNDTFDGSILETRPYSPSDATVYDPELPGVLGTNTNVPMPLQPPPLPPLGILPMMSINPMNLLGTYPIIPMSGFAPVNPMLTTPFIPFTSTAATTAVAPVNNTVTQLIEEFETDLDGSPLVPIEPKDTPNWKFIGEPLYLPDMNKLPMSGLVPVPVLKSNKQLQKTPPMKKPSENLFRNAEMRPVMIEDENKISGAMFKPIKLPLPVKKAVTTQPAAAFDSSIEEAVDSQKQIWPELEQDLRELEELEEQENKRRQELEEKKKQELREAEERKKQEQREADEKRRREEKEEAERRKKREREEADRRRRIRETPIRRIRRKSVTPAPRVRRRSARTPSRARGIYRHKSSRSSRDSESRSKTRTTETSKEKPDERKRKVSIDDDEQALREILLASLAKRKPNAKRKAALEAARRKAALEATKATSDKENIAEKPAETCSAVPEVDKLQETFTLEKPPIVATPQSVSPASTANNVAIPLTDVSAVLMQQQQQQQSSLKRPDSTLLPIEQPPRKVVKKLNAIPASTRAVNNAIRYQNMFIQRKLFAQQKQALYKTRFAVNNGQRSESPQIIQSPSLTQRFVISLNEDTESEPETDEKKKESPTKNRPLLAIPTSDFEQSVDQFLKGMRLQQEFLATTTSVTISKPASPPIVVNATSSETSKTVTTTTTPAVTVVATAAAAAGVAKIAVTTAATVAKVAVTTSTTIAVPKVVTTNVTTSLPKERTVLNIPKPITIAKLLSIPATPQVVKHLPKSQQEEYRRLKQQIYQYEQHRLQKSQESTIAVTTTSKAQPTTVKPVDTSSSPSTPSSSSTVLASSTPKASVAKLMPKTQLIAAISPMAKPNNVTPVVVTSTKVIHATSNATTKTTAAMINTTSKVTSSSTTESSSSKPILTSTAKVTQPDPSQLKLLSKITESLNSTKTLLNTAASKISSISSKSLKVLTMEQINQKTSRIKQKHNDVVMDDLNKTAENNVATEKKDIIEGHKIIKEIEPSNKMEQVDAMKESVKEASSAAEKSKDEDKTKQTWDDFRQIVSNEVQTLSNLSTKEQKKLLTETEGKLISKRHAVLDDITVMSGNLRQWEVERDLTNTISAEIVSLREQLRIAEEKLQGQKVKLQKIQPKVTLYHQKINTGRKECFRLSKICNGLGQQIIGSGYKVPTAGAELLNTRIKEVATHTQKLRGKVVAAQSNNAAKTGRSLKNNSKANVSSNSNVEKLNKKQNNKVDTKVDESDFIRFSDVSEGNALTVEVEGNGACTAISMVAAIRKSKNIFNKHNSKKPMDAVNGNSFIKLASTKKPQSTNVNINRYKRISRKKFKSKRKSEKVQKPQSKVASATAVNNATTSSMKIDHRSDSNTKNKISNNDVGATKESNTTEVTKKKESTSENEISNNKPEILNVKANSEAEIKTNGIVNNNSDISSIAIVDESLNNTSNEQSDVNAPSQILDVARVVDETNRNETASSNNEKLPAVQVGQSADVTDNSIETNSQKQLEKTSENVTDVNVVVQCNVPTESENIVNEIHTSNSILNNAVNDAPDKMEIDIADVNMTDETRTDEQSMNSGPTIVITDNVESDSVNNNASSVVNTSLDDYMKEMTVSEEYDNMCSKDYKSSASVTSNDHSTTFDEEIRLLEIASESDVPHDITSDYQATAAVEDETSDNCLPNAMAEHDDRQSEVKAQQETIDDCRFITTAEREIMNSKSSMVRIEHHVTDNIANQSRQKTISNKAYRPYDSILKLVRAPRNDKTDGILCPFALMGTCSDHKCRFIHQPTSHCR